LGGQAAILGRRRIRWYTAGIEISFKRKVVIFKADTKADERPSLNFLLNSLLRMDGHKFGQDAQLND
jgi:hypothetical protein